MGARYFILSACRSNSLGARRYLTRLGDAVGSRCGRRSWLGRAGRWVSLAYISASEGGGLPYRRHLSDGLLPVHRTFSSVFSYLGGHEVIERWVIAANLSATGFLILAQFIIFCLGWPLEWTVIIIIFVPIFLPLVKHFHIDPTLFGILVALNIQTSFNTPPMAMAAYYLKGVAPPHVR